MPTWPRTTAEECGCVATASAPGLTGYLSRPPGHPSDRVPATDFPEAPPERPRVRPLRTEHPPQPRSELFQKCSSDLACPGPLGGSPQAGPWDPRPLWTASTSQMSLSQENLSNSHRRCLKAGVRDKGIWVPSVTAHGRRLRHEGSEKMVPTGSHWREAAAQSSALPAGSRGSWTAAGGLSWELSTCPGVDDKTGPTRSAVLLREACVTSRFTGPVGTLLLHHSPRLRTFYKKQ